MADKLKTAEECRICGCCGNGMQEAAKKLGVAPKVTCHLGTWKKHLFFDSCNQFVDLKNFKAATRPL